MEWQTDFPENGTWCWVSDGKSVFPLMRNSGSARGWGNADALERRQPQKGGIGGSRILPAENSVGRARTGFPLSRLGSEPPCRAPAHNLPVLIVSPCSRFTVMKTTHHSRPKKIGSSQESPPYRGQIREETRQKFKRWVAVFCQYRQLKEGFDIELVARRPGRPFRGSRFFQNLHDSILKG